MAGGASKWIDRGYPVLRALRISSISLSKYYWRRSHRKQKTNLVVANQTGASAKEVFDK
jgi:hypothetical protein